MPLADLLQWLGTASKSGTLQVERERATRTLRMRNGHLVGCSSDHPPQRLGQFLLSRKKITEEQLSQALHLSKELSQLLGQTLVEMGALTEQELVRELEAKAEEIVYSLFDWSDGVFRFEETIDAVDAFPVDIRIEDILLRGLVRLDEMEKIRKVFHDPGIVLRYTSKPPGPEIYADDTSRAMYAAIDGERTLADILLHVHGSEYQVKTFFFGLLERGYVEVAQVRRPSPKPQRELAGAVPEEAEPVLAPDLDADLDIAPLDLREVGTEPHPATVAAVVAEAAPAAVPSQTLPEELARVNELMGKGSIEAALDLLGALYRQHPGDDALRRLTAEAEATFVEKAYRHYVPAHQVPVLRRPIESLQAEKLSPQECFILSRVDGSWDVRSIVQVAPIREVEALRTLKRLRELAMIELSDPV
jgi:hypothetical protein